MLVSERIRSVIEALEEAHKDAIRFEKGMDAPATRVRKACQVAKTDLHEIRGEIQKIRHGRKAAKQAEQD